MKSHDVIESFTGCGALGTVDVPVMGQFQADRGKKKPKRKPRAKSDPKTVVERLLNET